MDAGRSPTQKLGADVRYNSPALLHSLEDVRVLPWRVILTCAAVTLDLYG